MRSGVEGHRYLVLLVECGLVEIRTCGLLCQMRMSLDGWYRRMVSWGPSAEPHYERTVSESKAFMLNLNFECDPRG